MLLVEAAIVHLFYRNSQFKGLFTLDVLSLNMLNRVSKCGILVLSVTVAPLTTRKGDHIIFNLRFELNICLSKIHLLGNPNLWLSEYSLIN